jgi:hypothetical protein
MLREALLASRFILGSDVSVCFGHKKMCVRCKVPCHTWHEIRHLAYRFRPLFSLDVAFQFYF